MPDCPRCDRTFAPDNQFCPHCGFVFRSTPKPKEAKGKPERNTNLDPVSGTSPRGRGSERSESKGKLEKHTNLTCPQCGTRIYLGDLACATCGLPICPRCGTAAGKAGQDDEIVECCPNCGLTLTLICPVCGMELFAGAEICPDCGLTFTSHDLDYDETLSD